MFATINWFQSDKENIAVQILKLKNITKIVLLSDPTPQICPKCLNTNPRNSHTYIYTYNIAYRSKMARSNYSIGRQSMVILGSSEN